MTQPARFPVTMTSSLLDDAEKCPQLFFQRFCERWQHEEESIHLIAGGAFAEGLAAARRAYYEWGVELHASWAVGLRAFLFAWNTDKDGFPKKPIERVYEALYAYFEVHRFDSDELQPAQLGPKRGIEFSFAIELPIMHPQTREPLLYSGRCDQLAQHGDVLFPTDEKTTGRLGEQWSSNFRLRGQFMGYVWAARSMGYDVAGVFVRGIGLHKEGPVFAQVPIYVPPYLVARWYESMLTKTQHLVDAWHSYNSQLHALHAPKTLPFPYAFGFACTAYGGCPHAERCASQYPERLDGWKQVERLYFEQAETNGVTEHE